MALLFTEEIKEHLKNEIAKCRNSMQVISAFCKIEALDFIESTLPVQISEKKLLVRFTMQDIISKATDFSIIDYCHEHDWELYVKFDLHAKIYIFDNERCITGSSNLTNRGLSLSDNCNIEAASFLPIDADDIHKIKKLFSNSILVTAEIKKLLEDELENSCKNLTSENTWSDKILNLLLKDISTIFAEDFPLYSDYKKYSGHKIDFLNLNENWTEDEIALAFDNCKIILWLKNTLQQETGNEIYFGNLTEKLHSVFVNDPAPYRKEIKELLSRMLQWISDLRLSDILVDRPHYSQRIRLVAAWE